MKYQNDPLFQFESPLKQSVEQLARVETSLQATRSWRLRDVLETAYLLAVQAHPQARSFTQWALANATHADAQDRLKGYLKICDATDQCPEIRATQSQPLLVEQLYDTQHSRFFKGSKRPEVLVVVFTTMFNNFGISNLVLYSLFQAFGVSILMLRDGTRASYLGGAFGMGNSLDSCAQAIERLAQTHQCKRILITGYSSGGYASYYVSTRMACAGYLGFSIVTDLRLDTALPTDVYLSKAIRERFDSKYLLDLSTCANASQPTVPRRLVVGENSMVDLLFTNPMRQIPGLEVIQVPHCRHDTPEVLLGTGTLQTQLAWLVAHAG